ncbi:predicted protein [Chaetomium globosum CBS 148.51]|uniref:Uncharacterized protein n=1 Tax=Chaetomium globosum (strain ATCC 6205 / CBS 148.51 / DSM 1962 / NBRC 6347 / NRRL 1970) TaxID=306901 RepID=Q2GX54_CHAGB|nr:uncharacterized protein CHGG_07450 [Chaetomium globosum CBS 148.51]EAQ86197.1 predicted protein [Chaetomium globosum CBS 148.51]
MAQGILDPASMSLEILPEATEEAIDMLFRWKSSAELSEQLDRINDEDVWRFMSDTFNGNNGSYFEDSLDSVPANLTVGEEVDITTMDTTKELDPIEETDKTDKQHGTESSGDDYPESLALTARSEAGNYDHGASLALTPEVLPDEYESIVADTMDDCFFLLGQDSVQTDSDSVPHQSNNPQQPWAPDIHETVQDDSEPRVQSPVSHDLGDNKQFESQQFADFMNNYGQFDDFDPSQPSFFGMNWDQFFDPPLETQYPINMQSAYWQAALSEWIKLRVPHNPQQTEANPFAQFPPMVVAPLVVIQTLGPAVFNRYP